MSARCYGYLSRSWSQARLLGFFSGSDTVACPRASLLGWQREFRYLRQMIRRDQRCAAAIQRQRLQLHRLIKIDMIELQHGENAGVRTSASRKTSQIPRCEFGGHQVGA